MYTIKPKTATSIVITGDYVVKQDTYNIIISNAMAPISVTLPDIETFTNSFEILFVNNSAAFNMDLILYDQILTTIPPLNSKKYIIFDQLLYSVSSAGAAINTDNYFKNDGTSSMTATLNMGSNKIINVANPTTAQDAATKAYFDSSFATSSYLKLDGTVPMAAALNMGTNKIVNVANPTAAQDVATKTYTDGSANVTCFKLDGTSTKTAALNMGSNKIVNVADPVNAQDAGTKNYADNNSALFVKLDGTSAMTGALNMGAKKITNVANPELAQDVVTKNYADNLSGTLVKLDGTSTMTGALNMGGNKISNVADPVAAQDIATKNFADSFPATVRQGTSYTNILKFVKWIYLGDSYGTTGSYNGYSISTSPAYPGFPELEFLSMDVYPRSSIRYAPSASSSTYTVDLTLPRPIIIKGYSVTYSDSQYYDAVTRSRLFLNNNGNLINIASINIQHDDYVETLVNNTIPSNQLRMIFDHDQTKGELGFRSLQIFA
jgi:hypothetical protein